MKSKILPILGHFLALGVLAWAIFPLARFYFSGFSGFGDYFVGYTFADYIKNHFALPPASWVYRLYTGVPLFTFYQWFSFYLMLPLTKLLGTGWGMEIYSFVVLMLFYFFSYLLFWQLSQNHLFSAFLTLILYYTLGVSEPLMRGGFISQNAIQFFLPLILLLITLYYRKRNKRLLILVAVLQGLALLGHSGIAIFLILAPTSLAIFFWWDEKTPLFSWQKIKDSLSHGLLALLVGLPVILVGIFRQLGPSGKATCETSTCIASISELKPYFNLWSLAVVAGVVVIASFWSIIRKRNCFKSTLPFLAMLGFVFAYLISTHYKMAITDALSTFLWPSRTVWVISLGLGAIAAALFGQIKGEEKLGRFALGFKIISSFVSLGLALWMIMFKPYDLLHLFEENRVGYEANGPQIARFTIDKYKVGPYKNYNTSMILPEWLPRDETDYRIDQLWHGDFGIWPLIASVPDVRAYAGTSEPRFNDWRSWLTASETDQLGEKENRGKQRQSNINQTFFMIDWYAIRYLNTSIDFVSKIIQRDFPYAPYLENDLVTDRHEVRTIRFEGKKEGSFSYQFDFWRIRQEYTSPIIKASNAPTVFFVGDEQSWVNFVRSLGVSNTNSRELIPVKGPELLEKLTPPELKKFDMVILYAYNYDSFNEAWTTLTRYVEEGGTLFIDTGREVKETDNRNLPPDVSEMPEILPSKVLKKFQLGETWDLDSSESSITKEIAFDQFSPLKFGDSEWTLSVIPEDKDLKAGSEVILRQGGKPILVTRRIGNGRVAWSGMNLPYYILNYQAVPEAKLLRQIISWGTGGLGEVKPQYSVQRPKPEKIKVMGENFKGVVFKENFDPGWRAKVNGQELKIYPAGPDVMYVPVPKSNKKPFKVEINYRGTLLNWTLFIISLASLGISLKYVLTGNFLKTNIKIFDRWWGNEEG